MKGRLRWWLVRQLNRLPGTCWASVASWAAWNEPWRDLGERVAEDRRCRDDAERTGSCWCSKYRATP